ncbi:MAG: type II toxin-antitoxin system RelE/ParE family toxin [Ignavibacteria bacterium]|nr:type II toxin-antitoxin system RelE/ParE family toxin [Ignavibacteria bacterium]
MKRIFITTRHFWSLWEDLGFGGGEARELEDELIKNPEKGSVVKETGGLRKLRWAYGGKGKRGGIRVLYVDFPEFEKLFFISLLCKGERAVLKNTEKKEITKIIKAIKEELKEKNGKNRQKK